MSRFSASSNGRPRQPNPEDASGLDETEDLPLAPEEDTSVIPDEERVLDMPS